MEQENKVMIAEEYERIKIETEHDKAEVQVRFRAISNNLPLFSSLQTYHIQFIFVTYATKCKYFLSHFILNQIKAAEGNTCSAQEGAQIEMELVDLRAEKAVVSLQVENVLKFQNTLSFSLKMILLQGEWYLYELELSVRV